MTLISVKMAAWRHRVPETAALFHEKAGISTENRHLTTKSASSDDFNAFVESSVPTLVRNDFDISENGCVAAQSTRDGSSFSRESGNFDRKSSLDHQERFF